MKVARCKLYAGFLAALVLLAGCGEVTIDGRVFKVPYNHRITGNIFFLPPSQSDGLHYILNPDATLPRQHMGLLESREVTCRFADQAVQNGLFYACFAAREMRVWPVSGEFEKVNAEGFGKALLMCVVKNGSGVRGRPVVASCSAMSDGGGLCRSFGTYKDLIYSIGLRESDMPKLAEIHARVRALLMSWEQ